MKISIHQYKILDDMLRARDRYKVITWSTINVIPANETGLRTADNRLTKLLTNVEEMDDIKRNLLESGEHQDLIPVIEILIDRHKQMAFDIVQIAETIRAYLQAKGILDQNEVPF